MRFCSGRTLTVPCLVLALAVPALAARADDALTLADEIMAVRATREDAIASASVRYRVRTPDTGWHHGRWASAPNGDVHAIGPLPPHALFKAEELWPVADMTHEVRQSATERVWSREDRRAGVTEIAIEPAGTTMGERLAGHPMIYDLVVDRWLAGDDEIQVTHTDYHGQPAAYVQTTNGNEAWLLADYDWAVAEMRDWSHNWIVRAAGFDRVPFLEGAAPQRLDWFFEDVLVLEIDLNGWGGPQESAVYSPTLEVGSGELRLVDRRVSPAASLIMPDLAAVQAYLTTQAVPPQSTEPPAPGEAERIAWVIDAQAAHDLFSLNDLPWFDFGIIEDGGEHFGYVAASDPRMDPFAPSRAGDVFLAIDGEDWRPESRADFAWLLGRLTWLALWDTPFSLTLLRDGELLEYELVWSYDVPTEG